MYYKALFIIAASLLFEISTPTPTGHVVHEERFLSTEWQKLGRVEPNAIVPVRIGLTQSNLDEAYDYLIDVSDPESANYGKHWTLEEVNTKFTPPDDTIKAVKDWLESSGVSLARVVHHDNKGWLSFMAPFHELENLTNTEFYEFENSKGALGVACDRYHLPAYLEPHIDYITPGVRLSAPSPKRQIRPTSVAQDTSNLGIIEEDHAISKRSSSTKGRHFKQHCIKHWTPACIRGLYQIPKPHIHEPHPLNSFGIFEHGLYYDQADQDTFFTMFSPYIPNGTHPIFDSIDGGITSVPERQGGSETQLDFQVAYPIAYPQKLTLYQSDDRYWARQSPYNLHAPKYVGLFNTWLDALDGSYCNYTAYGETGDAPFDPKYPDKTHKDGYKHPEQCGVYKPTKIISISYGETENVLPYSYQKRQCNEFTKLGLQGISIFVASGDSGVNEALTNGHGQGCLGPKGKRFGMSTPDGCPAVTNVGGTIVKKDKPAEKAEESWEGSAGGFSNVFPRPKYQDATITTYLKNHTPPYPSYAKTGVKPHQAASGRFNRIGRGVPDLAALANFIMISNQGHVNNFGVGTSAAAPIVAAIFARINEDRLRAGKSVVGFVNPVLYKHPEILHDIDSGATNFGCHTPGFKPVKGWDPTTGLGSPSYPKMRKLFMSLP